MMVFIIIAGYLATQSQKYNTLPSIDVGAASITTVRPGSSSQDIELSITVPLEEEILRVDGIDKVISNSFEGMSKILVVMDPDNSWYENDMVENDIQRAIDRATSRLPNDLPEKPHLVRYLSDKLPVLEVFITGSVPEETLRQVARQMQKSLREVEGIGGVSLSGYRKKEVRIQLDANRMHQLGISFNEISQAIERRNVRDSGGSLDSFVSERDVLTIGQFEDPKEVEDVILRANGPGNYVRIRDVATVLYDYEDWVVQKLSDREAGITLLPSRKANADGLKVAENIHEFVAQKQASLPPGVSMTIVNDSSRYTRDILSVLINNALAGITFVFLVLLCFFPMRFTIWVTAGIPISILMAFALMPFFGIDVNQITVGAFILMLGLLVDDAIVTSESIFRRAEAGYSPIDAAILGTDDVARPVITSAATTLLAFAPAAFLGGLEGKFMWVVPTIAILCLSGSLFECKAMMPSHICHSLQHYQGKTLSRQWFETVESYYQGFMQWVIPHRYKAALIFILSFGLVTYWALNRVSVNLYPEVAVDAFYIQAELPIGASFENTRDQLLVLDQAVRDTIPAADIMQITLTVGHHDYDVKQMTAGRQASWGLVGVFLQPREQRTTDTVEAMQALRKKFKSLKQFKSLIVVPQRETPTVGSAVELEIIGNHDDRYEVAEIVANFLKQHPGTTEVWTSHVPGKDIIEVKIDHEALANYGFQVADVTRAVRAAFDGFIVDELQTIDERIDFRIQYAKPEQGSLEALRSIVLVNPQGLTVPLRRLVDFEMQPGESNIKHYLGERSTTIFAEIDRSLTSTAAINQQLQDFIEEQNLKQRYRHFRFIQGGEFAAQQQALGRVGTALTLCVIGILFLLVLLFNSMTQPLLILSILPFGFTGVVFAFAVHHIEMSLAGMVGLIGLSGVLVNDSLVLIDRLNQEKQHSRDLLDNESIVRASVIRLRPILITTVTTVAGLIPAAYGLGGSSPFLTPMFMSLLWGIMFGSFVTLFLLPCLFAMEQDLRRLLLAYWHRFLPKR